LPETGNYSVYAWWVDGPNRGTNAKYTIYYGEDPSYKTTVELDQSINGGQWNLLGSYTFPEPHEDYPDYEPKVVLTDEANGYVVADAIRWEFDNPPPSLDIIVDSGSADFVCEWTCVNHANAYPGEGNASVQVGGITNNTYSTNFGGGTPTLTTIYDAFNPSSGGSPSSHNLSDIQGYVEGYHDFTAETNACLACHHNHLGQRNYPVTSTMTGGVQTAIRRPVHNDALPGNLWGDEDFATSGRYELTSDLFANYGLTYQAPYYVGGSGSTYEPGGNGTSNGSNLPDLITFCLDCHKHSDVPSTERGRYLRKIDYSNAGGRDEHGLRNEYKNTNQAETKDPYPDQAGNYMLVCTDCHEPHGSQNEWLLRTTVNGTDVSIPGPNQWWYFCAACHKGTTPYSEDWPADQHTSPWDAGTDCYNNGICHHHSAGGGMF
jgi:hypothetical protein